MKTTLLLFGESAINGKYNKEEVKYEKGKGDLVAVLERISPFLRKYIELHLILIGFYKRDFLNKLTGWILGEVVLGERGSSYVGASFAINKNSSVGSY